MPVEPVKPLTIWLIILAVIFVLFVFNAKCPAQQVTCNRQPMSGLKYEESGHKYEASEWHCTGTEEQAFQLLSSNNIAPFTPATVDKLAEFTNKESLRTKFLKGASYVSLFVGPLAALPTISEVAYKALLGGAPIASKILTEIAGGLPKDFTPMESSGYSVVYAAASQQNRVIQNSILPVAPVRGENSVLELFHSATWYSLFKDTSQGRKKVIQQWRAVDENWKIEEKVNELRDRMNFGEAEMVLARN